MKKWITLFLVTIANTISFAVGQIEVDLEPQLIGKDVSFYVDDSNASSLEDILILNSQNEFTLNQREVFAHPASPSTFWFSFSTTCNLDAPIWINVFNQGFDEIDFYLLNEEGELVRELSTGVFKDKNTRAKNSKTFWFNLYKAKEFGERTVYIKIKFSGIMEVPIMIGGYEELLKVEDESEFYAIFFIGALLIMFLYNCSIWFFTKDHVYGFYSGYIFCALLVTTHVNNYPIVADVLGANFAYNYLFVWFAPISFFIAAFIIRYLQLDKRAKRHALIVRIAASLVFITCLLNLFIPTVYITNVFQIVSALLLISCLVIGYSHWLKGFNRARYYSIAWSCNILSIFIYMAVSNGFLPFTAVSRNVMYLGILLELIIFSIALAQRLNEFKNTQVLLNKKLLKANLSLSNSNESLDAFNNHVSHDLKTVLNNQLVLSRMINKYIDKDNYKKVQEITARLIDSGENGVETVRSFLEISKEGFVQSDIGEKEINVTTEIARILEENELVGQLTVRIIREDYKGLKIGAKVLESILLNLFTNSIKYNNQAPEVEIELRMNDSLKQIVFNDNGIGIDLEKDGLNLFKPFNRIENEKHTEGSGIGLYLIKKLINSLEGEIEVESELNKGTQFTISFNNR